MRRVPENTALLGFTQACECTTAAAADHSIAQLGAGAEPSDSAGECRSVLR